MNRFFGRRRLKRKYKLQAEQLAKLGFPNRELSIKLLELYAGDSDLVLEEYYDANAAKAETFRVEGNKMMRKKQYQQAIDLYSQCIQLDPRKVVYYANRAAAYIEIGEYKAAIRDGQIASKIDRNYAKSYLRLGNAYCGLGEFEKAECQYREALSLVEISDTANYSYIIRKIKFCKDKKLKTESEADTPSSSSGGDPNSKGGDLDSNSTPFTESKAD